MREKRETNIYINIYFHSRQVYISRLHTIHRAISPTYVCRRYSSMILSNIPYMRQFFPSHILAPKGKLGLGKYVMSEGKYIFSLRHDEAAWQLTLQKLVLENIGILFTLYWCFKLFISYCICFSYTLIFLKNQGTVVSNTTLYFRHMYFPFKE